MRLLDCKISDGMFTDEFNIRVVDAKQRQLTVFVPKDKVRVNSNQVIVRAVEKGDVTVVVLPDADRTTIIVAGSSLSLA